MRGIQGADWGIAAALARVLTAKPNRYAERKPAVRAGVAFCDAACLANMRKRVARYMRSHPGCTLAAIPGHIRDHMRVLSQHGGYVRG